MEIRKKKKEKTGKRKKYETKGHVLLPFTRNGAKEWKLKRDKSERKLKKEKRVRARFSDSIVGNTATVLGRTE